MTAGGQAPARTTPGDLAPSHVLRAALWMAGAVTSFSAMAVAGREVQLQLNTFELMTWRSVVGFLIIVATATLRGRLGEIRARRPGLHLARNIAHFAGQNLWFWALTLIPLAQVFALEFTGPVWVALIAPFLLAEPLTRARGIAVVLGFAGILIVAHPFGGPPSPGLIAAASAAVCFAFTAIFTKRLTRSETVLSILFWMTVLQAAFGVICAFLWAGHLTLPDAATAPGLLVIGCAGLAAHFCLTSALSFAPASIVMPLDFTRLPVIAVIGMVVYGESLDPYVFLGAAVIFAANFYNIRVETRAPMPRS
jgi:drug/metabolite transporter (DMT)-like permease